MPKYDYKCSNCGEIEEKEYRITKKRPKSYKKICPKCSLDQKTKRKYEASFSKSSFILEGSGWAKDNYS